MLLRGALVAWILIIPGSFHMKQELEVLKVVYTEKRERSRR
jgi:hypothetical protein